jgi:hypothetical protein
MYFMTKNPNLGKFWSVLQCKMLANFMAFGPYYYRILLSFWYIFPRFGMLYQEKSGSSAQLTKTFKKPL